jgi:hypothetical protein
MIISFIAHARGGKVCALKTEKALSGKGRLEKETGSTENLSTLLALMMKSGG